MNIHKKGFGTVLIVGAVALVLAIGGTLAIVANKEPIPPQELVDSMFAGFSELESLKYRVNINAESAVNKTELTLEADQTVNTFNDMRGVWKAGIKTDGGYTRGFLDGFEMGAEIRIVDAEFYALLTAPADNPNDSLGPFINQWIKGSISVSESEESFISYDFSGAENLSEEQLTEIRLALKKYPLLLVVSDNGIKETEEGKLRHITTKINKENLTQLMIALNEIVNEETFTAEKRKEGEEAITAWQESSQLKNVEVWVDEKSGLPRKIAAKIDSFGDDSFGENIGTADVSITFLSFNKQVVVDVPENARSFEEIMQEIFSGFENMPIE